MLNIKSVLNAVIPFAIGLIIGLTITGNYKWLLIILPIYIASTIILQLITNAISKVDKKTTINDIAKEATISTIEKAIDQTAIGMKKGNDIYDKIISFIIPLTLLGLLSTTFYLLYLKELYNAGTIFSLFIVIMLIRDIRKGG